MRVSVVGESFYQDALKRVSKCPPVGDHRYECSAKLVLEPDNPHDKFAVRVEVDGKLVGYLPRGSARRFNKRLRAMAERGQPAICMAFIGRSEDAGHNNLGVVLRVPYDSEILGGRS
jgi:hypothetical protein